MEKQTEEQELKDIIASREDGFGYRLKIARNENNLSTSDVARELRLNEKIIRALESEDDTQLPQPAFVCGYIRNYAKFLKIQPEPLIEYYKRERNEDTLESELKITKGKQNRKKIIDSNLILSLLMVLILLALVAGSWGLWQYVSKNYIDTDDLQRSMGQSESVESADAVEEQSNDNPEILTLPVAEETYYTPPVEETLEQEPRSDVDVPGTDDVLSNDAALSTEGALVEGPSPAEDSLSAEGSSPAEGSPPAPENATNTLASANDSGLMSSEASDNKLILEFSGNSWINIKDGNNKILATGLKKTGQILQLEGKKPYKVFLGDARMVKVSFNGKIFDHANYINEKNIARFNVE